MKQLLAVGLCLGLLACTPGSTDSGTDGGTQGTDGGTQGTDGGDTGGPVTVDQLSNALVQTVCAESTCYDGDSPSACTTTAADLSDFQKALASGRATLDQAKAKACVAEAAAADGTTCWGENASTTAIDQLGDDCVAAITPMVALGGDCYATFECVSGYCDLSGSCPGKCTAAKASGVACEDDTECQAGLVCAYNYDDGSQACATPLAKGDDCSNFDCPAGLFCNASNQCDDTVHALGDDCSDGAQCATGSFCNSDSVCAAQGHAGDACDDPGFDFFGLYSVLAAQDCLGQQVCLGGVGDGSNAGHCSLPSDVNGTCIAANVDDGPGSVGCYAQLACDDTSNTCLVPPTTEGAACVSGTCGGDLVCNESNQCVELPTTVGADCVDDECGGDLSCGDDGKCAAAPSTVGAACPDYVCGAGLWCDDTGDTPVCATLPAIGETCTEYDECADGAYCDDSTTCVALKADGDQCEDSEECQSGSCDDTSGTCVASTSDGGVCTAP